MAKRNILNDFNVSGDVTSNAFVTVGGAVSDFVKGDGTLDSNTYDNYNSWNLKTNGIQRINVVSGSNGTGGTLDISGGTNITTSYSAGGVVTINSTIPLYAGTTAGLVPTGTNGIIKFLREDGSWSAPSMGSGSTVTHEQSVGATTWSFSHNLGTRYPIIQVWDSNDQEIIPLRIEVIDINNVEIEFSTSRTGVASAVAGGISVPGTTMSALTDTELSATTNGHVLTYNSATSKWISSAPAAAGVTSVDMSVPTGLSIANNPITSSGTLALTYTVGYAIPLTSKQTEWDTAYNDKINSASFNTGDGILTLTQQDAGTVTVDLDGRYSETAGVTSVSAGNGMTFTTITATGAVTMGTPSTITSATSNGVTTDSHTHAITTGIVNTNIVKIDSTTVADNEYARFTANGLESRSNAEVLSDIGAGTGNVTKVGTPVNNQVGVWTGDGTLEGDTGLTYTASQLSLGVNDTTKGLLHVYGDTTTGSGEIRIYNGATQDTTDDYFSINATTSGGFRLAGSSTGNFLGYTPTTGGISIWGALFTDQSISSINATGASAVASKEYVDQYQGNVTKVGTPVNNQLGVWTGDGTLEGDTGLNFQTGTKHLELGIEDTTRGILSVKGQATGTGGELRVFNSGDVDTDDNYYQVRANIGTFNLKGVNTGNFLTYTSATQQLSFPDYGGGTFTAGTATYSLTVDASGNIVEGALGGGAATIVDDAVPTVVSGGTWYQPSEGILSVGINDEWVEVNSVGAKGDEGPPAASSSGSSTTIIDLSFLGGYYYDMASANSSTTYTTSNPTLGGFACVLINTTSEPTVTGATKIKGSDWVTGTDMQMWVQFFGNTVQFFFTEI